MNVMDKLGWKKDLQTQIKNVARNSRESVKHLVIGMRSRSFTGELLIQVVDRSGLTPKIVATSGPIDSRGEQIELYDELIRRLDLPYCCIVHKEERQKRSFFDDLEDDPDDFQFIDESDPDDFEFIDDSDEGFDFDAEDGFDFD